MDRLLDYLKDEMFIWTIIAFGFFTFLIFGIYLLDKNEKYAADVCKAAIEAKNVEAVARLCK